MLLYDPDDDEDDDDDDDDDGLDPVDPYDANCWSNCWSCSCGKADTADKVADVSRPTDFKSNP
jgi:hypothetical protein